jgi:hypothetical protein
MGRKNSFTQLWLPDDTAKNLFLPALAKILALFGFIPSFIVYALFGPIVDCAH